MAEATPDIVEIEDNQEAPDEHVDPANNKMTDRCVKDWMMPRLIS